MKDIKEKFPLKIIKDKLSNKHKAATLIDKINDETKNIQEELSFIESDYGTLISNILRISSEIAVRPKKKKDVRLYWLIGENIIHFIERLDDLGFYLLKQNKTFAADTDISESSICKIISFRKRFPKISMLDTKISWSKYRDKKV